MKNKSAIQSCWIADFYKNNSTHSLKCADEIQLMVEGVLMLLT